jgi:hypothetical protein
MAHDATPAEQHELVREAIVEVASRCDGAQSLDGKGFSGVDTKFGKRIAAVPFAQWTPEVQLEANKIILKYREQVLNWTDGRIDVGTLSVVKDAQDYGTNYKGRNDALGYEKRAKHLAARQIGVVRNAKGQRVLGIRWANGDPDFSTFLGLVKALPGRTWNGATKTNEVPFTPQVAVFIDEWDFTVTESGQAFITDTLTADTVAPEVHYEITVDEGSRLFIKTDKTAPGKPGNSAVMALPGRAFDRVRYGNTVNVSPQVLIFARDHGITIHPDAVKLCEAAQAALGAQSPALLGQADLDTILNTVSRAASPEDLPAVFVAMLSDLLEGN